MYSLRAPSRCSLRIAGVAIKTLQGWTQMAYSVGESAGLSFSDDHYCFASIFLRPLKTLRLPYPCPITAVSVAVFLVLFLSVVVSSCCSVVAAFPVLLFFRVAPFFSESLTICFLLLPARFSSDSSFQRVRLLLHRWRYRSLTQCRKPRYA